MQKCFESRDIGMLQDVVMKMPKEEAEYHIKRCIDSGLWVPNAADAEKADEEGDGKAAATQDDSAGDDKEETYEEVIWRVRPWRSTNIKMVAVL